MISIANVLKTSVSLPARVLVHGLEGVGKSSLGAKFPRAIFAQTEDGTPSGLEIESFGLLQSYAEFLEALAALGNEGHDFTSLIVDSIDKLEGLIWADVCAKNHWPSIEAPGYGKGYVVADNHWREILAGLDWLRRTRGMTIVLLAHSAVETVNDPRTPSYTSYQLRLHRRARGLIADEMDLIAFLATDVFVMSEDAGFSRKRSRADGSAGRHLHTEGRPAFLAKTRFDLPPKIACPKDFDVNTVLAPIFPAAAREPIAAVRSVR
jgi:hypothetical protein